MNMATTADEPNAADQEEEWGNAEQSLWFVHKYIWLQGDRRGVREMVPLWDMITL